jgi:hypothetical protein
MFASRSRPCFGAPGSTGSLSKVLAQHERPAHSCADERLERPPARCLLALLASSANRLVKPKVDNRLFVHEFYGFFELD